MENRKPHFKAQIFRHDNGKLEVHIQAISETITREDGKKDVIIHAPSLRIINRLIKNHK